MSRILRVITRLVLLSIILQSFLPLGTSFTAFALSKGKSFKVSPGQAAKLSYEGATLEISAGSVSKDTTITIIPLEEPEMPVLDQGMADVTLGPRRAYRLLPHNMKFNKPITIKLPYDPALIPAGLTEQDIKTFYFDDQSGYWQELDRVSVDTKNKIVVSLSDHFTDMINATVTVPDHPQPLSYNPNSIKDMKAADPSAGISLIDPPSAASSGDAMLLYPIILPAGVNGMNPQLGLSYSSGGGNGWLGLGWDLPASSVTIDTRWGVPRYDANDETETYVLDGAQLAPVAHRGPLQPRTAEKQFFSRVESSFMKITRHGDDPANYWWEVTNKDGTRYFYGGAPGQGADANSVLADPGPSKNIFRWMLKETRDSNGNVTRYFYDVVSGGGAGSEPWRQVYLSSIRYTGTAASDGPYEVVFTREGGRPDVIVDGRPGFKTVLSDVLATIDVKLLTEANPLIRRYRLEYETGAFQKYRLARVIQYGEDGTTEFNRHSFDYYDEVTTGPSQPTVLDGFHEMPGFGDATTVDGEGILFDQESTAFGGNTASSDQTHFYGGISPAGYSKENSYGVKVGQELSSSNTLLSLIDLNGDGLLDQVYEDGGSIYFRANTGGPQSAPNFAPNPVKIQGLSELGSEGSQTFTIGGEIFKPGGSVFVDISFTRSRGDSYLSDVNGDGLVDLVVKGKVYFNTLVNGAPTFGTNSPTPLASGADSDTGGMVTDPEAGKADMEAEYHLVDPLRRWVAPYTGKVSITGSYGLLSAPPASYTTADGVRLSIQHNGTEIWSETIADPTDTSTKTIPGLASVDVTAGDRLYFRVNSINDGSYDAVEFNPTITYNQLNTGQVDENNMPQFVYNAGTDFSFGGRELPFTVPFNGTATLSGRLEKSAITSDDITLVTVHNGALAIHATLPADNVGWVDIDIPFTLAANDSLVVFLAADSRIDLSKVSFTPDADCNVPGKGQSPVCVAYNTIDGQPAPMDQNGKPLLVFTPPVTAQVYPRNASNTPYTPKKVVFGEGGGGPGTCEDGVDNDNNTLVDLDDPSCTRMVRVHWPVTVDLFYDMFLPGDSSTLNYNMTMSAKRPGERLAKQRVDILDGAVVDGQPLLEAKFEVKSGDNLYFTLDARATDASTLAHNDLSLVSPQIIIENPYGSEGMGGAGSCSDGIDNDGDGFTDVDDPECQSLPQSAPVDVHMSLATFEPFGGGFRGWGYGQYNGQDTTSPVDESLLRLPLDEEDDAADFYVPMVPFLDEDNWRAEDEEAWISDGQMSASRLMVNYLEFPTGAGFGGGRGVVRYGGGQNLVAGGGLGFSVLSFGEGQTLGGNWSDIDFLDFNGDDYPDVVGGGEVQTTLPNGALDDERIPVGGFERVRESESDNNNVNLGATMSRQVGNAQGYTKGITTEQAAYNLGASLGLSGGIGSSDAVWDLVDINGDGLPDYVRRPDPQDGETDIAVRLNLGYRFGLEETWSNASLLRYSESLGVGLSTGGGVTLPAYSFGGGFSHTLSLSAAETDLVDVNGDGLVDLVNKDVQVLTATQGVLNSDSTALAVRFNTGAGFTAEIYTYDGAMQRPIQTNATVSRNLGLHFTIAIPIPFTTASIILNPGYNHSNSLGGYEVMLSDFDGDGYADHIYSDTEGNVEVNLNNHGRTNLLKTVYRPLGAEIELDYARSGNTTDHPGNHWVLSRTTVKDGHPGDGPDQQVTTYQYAGGKFDRAEREFYGFRTVVEEHRNGNAVYRSVTRDFLNSTFYNKGLLERELTQDGNGNKYLETVNQYSVINVAGGISGLEDFTAVRFPALVKTTRSFYEGNANPGKTTFASYTYDYLGNITHYFDAGDPGTQDDIQASIQYSQCQASYIVGIPTSIVVTGSSALMRRREASVNCSNGNLEQVREYLEDGSFAQTDLVYFDNGNLKRATSPENLNGDRYFVDYQYDPDVSTYLSNISDLLGYSSSVSYDPKHGLVLETIDLNNNHMAFAYDQFGRVVAFTGPYDQGAPVPTIRFEYHPEAAVPWALTRHYDPFRDPSGADTIDNVIFIDGLKRIVQTKKDATIYDTPGGPAVDRMIVSGKTTFDFVGRVVEQRYPVTELPGSPGVPNTEVDPVQPTVTQFDILNRQIKITLPDNTTNSFVYGFGLDRLGATQFEASSTDANGIVTKTYQNVRNLVTSMKQSHTPPGGGAVQTLWTSYAYDPLQQLVEIKDANDNTSIYSYDNLGRRTVMNNPDTGKTELFYDKASNLVAKVTANLRVEGKQVAYNYDKANRLVSITYPNFTGNNVTYTYGAPGAGDNRAGRITLVQDQSGTEERFYGKLGEITQEVKTIIGFTGAPPNTYTTRYTYDSFGRLQSLTYPDGEVLTYLYDSGGQLRQASGQKGPNTYLYISRLEYDKFDQQAFREVGNGVRTEYTYDAQNRRLANLKAGLAGLSPFQNLLYQYDAVGNVLGLTNNVPVPAASEFGGPVTQVFAYDDLYRLTGASGAYNFAPGKTNKYSLSMAYDNIHNIVSKKQDNAIVQTSGTQVTQLKTTYSFAYQYGAAQPHAASKVDNRSFTYDANGNQAGWTHDLNGTRRTVVWDEENRAQSIFDNGHEKMYKYDDTGERVVKRGPQGETVYVNQYFTVRNGQIGTKHVFAGTSRFVSKLLKQNPTVVEKDQYFYHPDHLGSSSFVTDAGGKLYEHLEYFPFGETWVQEASNIQRTPYLFTSKELDEETGLYYYGARYYDPRSSQFASPDPLLVQKPEKVLRHPGLLGAFSYTLNNPLIYTDPDGREPQKLQIYLVFGGASGISKDDQESIQTRVEKLFTDVKVGVDVKIITGAVSMKTIADNKIDTKKDAVVFFSGKGDANAVAAIEKTLTGKNARGAAAGVAGVASKGITFTEKGKEEGAGKAVAFVGLSPATKDTEVDTVNAANLAAHEIAAHIIGVGHDFNGTIKLDDLLRENWEGIGVTGNLGFYASEIQTRTAARLGNPPP